MGKYFISENSRKMKHLSVCLEVAQDCFGVNVHICHRSLEYFRCISDQQDEDVTCLKKVFSLGNIQIFKFKQSVREHSVPWACYQ